LFPFFKNYYRDHLQPTLEYDFNKWPTQLLKFYHNKCKGPHLQFDGVWIKKLGIKASNATKSREEKIRLNIGYEIECAAEDARRIMLNNLNKHWPAKEGDFKSGQTPSGLLYLIRKKYFLDVVAVDRALGTARTTYNRDLKKLKDGIEWKNLDKDTKDEKIAYCLGKIKFDRRWYPNCWLTFISYGPCCHSGQQLQYLHRLQELPNEEVEDRLKAYGKQSKSLRDQLKKNSSPQQGSTVTVSTAIERIVHVKKTVVMEKPTLSRKEVCDDMINTLKLELDYTEDPEERALLISQLKDVLEVKKTYLHADFKALPRYNGVGDQTV
jgi:hypothetical protein